MLQCQIGPRVNAPPRFKWYAAGVTACPPARMSSEPNRRPHYFAATVRVAEPPRLLRTVTLCGFEGHVNWPLYLPPPSFVSVPMSAPVEVT